MLIWVDNVAAALAMLDTNNVDSYFSNASAYHDELAALDVELRERIDMLPEERRKLVTDHREFAYFAQDYGFDMVGAVIPASSTCICCSRSRIWVCSSTCCALRSAMACSWLNAWLSVKGLRVG